MPSRIIMRLHRALLLVALTVALVGTGFAHRVTAAEDQVLAFVLATGATAADICDDATPGDDHRGPSCLACQIAGGADLPSGGGAVLPLDLASAARITVAQHAVVIQHKLDHSHASQAPPTA
jgi:hypothetical protein